MSGSSLLAYVEDLIQNCIVAVAVRSLHCLMNWTLQTMSLEDAEDFSFPVAKTWGVKKHLGSDPTAG